MLFVFWNKSLYNLNCLVGSRFQNVNFLEAAGQGSVFFKVLGILFKGSLADKLYFSACKYGLKKVSGIYLAGTVSSGSHNHMNFIYK